MSVAWNGLHACRIAWQFNMAHSLGYYHETGPQINIHVYARKDDIRPAGHTQLAHAWGYTHHYHHTLKMTLTMFQWERARSTGSRSRAMSLASGKVEAMRQAATGMCM